jgi:hypothetical protein
MGWLDTFADGALAKGGGWRALTPAVRTVAVVGVLAVELVVGTWIVVTLGEGTALAWAILVPLVLWSAVLLIGLASGSRPLLKVAVVMGLVLALPYPIVLAVLGAD